MFRLFLIVVLTSISLVAQAKHPFTFEDMMALKRVEEPEVSPDGKWVLFAAVDVDLKANTKTPHVWIAPLTSLAVDRSTASKTSQAKSSTSLGMTENKSGMTTSEREIISDQDADRPRWARDGEHFAFISTKENGSQVWIADFDGATGTVTEKHRLTNIATEADGELWSPDGKNILFKSDVYPECDGTASEGEACNFFRVQESNHSKVHALIFTHLLYRHWNAYKEGKRTHLFVMPVSGDLPGERSEQDSATPLVGSSIGRFPPARYRDLTPGNYDAPVFSLGGQDDYAFSPDGQEICYASDHDPEPAISTNNDLFTVPVNFPPDATSKDVLAATKNITVENKAADNTPLYSPDGKYIAYRAQQRPGYESDRWRLMLYNRKTGDRRDLTEENEFDRWVGSFAWMPDSLRILFTAEDRGMQSIYALDIVAKKFPIWPYGECELCNSELHQLLWTDPYSDDISVGKDGNIWFTTMSVTSPTRIVHLGTEPYCLADDMTKCGHVPFAYEPPVESINDSVLSQIEILPLHSFWFTGANNDKVQGFVVTPPNFDPNKKYPVKFIVHGGPEVAMGNEWSYRWNAELFAANGYLVIWINFHGSPGYGQKFIDAINGDWGGAPFEDLMKGLDYAEQHYSFIDKDRECALGASYGGYMMNWILGHTDRFKCIVTHDGMFNTESAWGTTEELWFNEWEFKGTPYTDRELYRKWSPHLSATNFKTPTLVIHSQLDYRLDVSQGFDLFTTLQRLGVPSKMLYFPDEGHWVLKPQNSQLWYKTVNDWVDQWIGNKPSQ